MIRLLLALSLILSIAAPSVAAVGKNGYRRALTMTHNSVTCPATSNGIVVIAADSKIASWAITNNSGTSVFIGDATVTTATGFELVTGASISDTGLHAYQGVIHCIVASGTLDVDYITTEW